MKPKTLLVLAALVATLAAGIYLFERDLPSTDERAALSKKVLPVESDELTALEIEWDGRKSRLERGAKPAAKAVEGEAEAPRKWRLLEPFATPADDAAVNGLASQLTALEVVRELEGASRADVGLEPPRGKVTWRTPKASGTLEIGGKIPAANEMVVAASGRAAPAVVSDSVVRELERAPGEWRSREVVTATRADIERVTLSAVGGAPITLTKSGETFRLEAPVADAADRDAVDQLLGDLTALRVETFLDEPLTENTAAALAAPAGKISVVAKEPAAPLEIELGGGEPLPGKRVARAGGQAFVATTRLLESVTRSAGDWRSRHWTRFENWRIERVTVDDPVGKLVVERKDGKWLRDGAEIPFTAASDLLYAITSAKAESIREGAAATDKPLLTLALADADGNEEVLTLHAAEAAVQAARVNGRDLTLLLPTSAATDVTSKLGALRAVAPVAPVAPMAPVAPVAPVASDSPGPPSEGNVTPVSTPSEG